MLVIVAVFEELMSFVLIDGILIKNARNSPITLLDFGRARIMKELKRQTSSD